MDECKPLLAGLRSRGIPAALHVERAGRRAPVHLTLAHRAAVVVTDEPFTEPWLTPCRKLASVRRCWLTLSNLR